MHNGKYQCHTAANYQPLAAQQQPHQGPDRKSDRIWLKDKRKDRKRTRQKERQDLVEGQEKR